MRPQFVSLFFVFFITISFVSSLKADLLTQKIQEIEHRLGGRVGVSVLNVKTKNQWDHKGDMRFPLMSTFKTLACANLLFDIEKGQQSFDTSVVVHPSSLISWSPITEKYAGKAITLKQACAATMSMSDNTAGNIVLSSIDGPPGLTQFMRSMGDTVSRSDRNEPDLNEGREGDERDTTTPNAMVLNLNTLLFGSRLSFESKKQLKQWMMDNQVSNDLLRSVLPKNWFIADRSGAGGYGSRGITAVVWSKTQAPLIISIYLTQTKASIEARNAAIAEIGKLIFNDALNPKELKMQINGK